MPPSLPCRTAELILGCLSSGTQLETHIVSIIVHVIQNVLVGFSQVPHHTKVSLCSSIDGLSTSQSSHISHAI